MHIHDAPKGRVVSHYPKDRMSREDSLAGRFQRAVLERIRVHRAEGTIPTDNRFVLYELEQLRFCTKGRRDSQRVSAALTHLSNIKLVGWAELEDTTRQFTSYRSAPSVADYIEDTLRRVLDNEILHRWGDGPSPMILCETRGVANALDQTARDYLCQIGGTAGMAKRHLINDVVPWVEPGRRALWVGDRDFSGGLIENHTRRTLIEHSGVEDLLWERVALTDDQVDWLAEEYYDGDRDRLVMQKYDNRFRPPLSYEAVEAEALGQRRIVDLVRDRLAELMLEITGETLDGLLVRQRQQREAAREQVDEMLRLLRGDEP
jgi:hypothetical protein